jgi:hypothetical protein
MVSAKRILKIVISLNMSLLHRLKHDWGSWTTGMMGSTRHLVAVSLLSTHQRSMRKTALPLLSIADFVGDKEGLPTSTMHGCHLNITDATLELQTHHPGNIIHHRKPG